MKTRTSIIMIVIVVMGLMAGIVSAQEGAPTGPGGDGERPAEPRGNRGQRGGERNGGPRGGAMAVVAEQLGLEPAEIIEQLQATEGTTLADVITANGGDVSAIVALLVADATEKINEHVTEGDITQEQADERLAELEANITERINSVPEARPERDGERERGRRNPLDGVVREWIESNTELTREDFQAGRDADLSLNDILTNAGADVGSLNAAVQAHLAEAVSNGDITQEQADEAFSRFTDKLNGVKPAQEAGTGV